MDSQTTIGELKDHIRSFMDEREWAQFHSPKNMSALICAEAAELLELFLWVEGEASCQELERKRMDVEDEVADIAVALLNFCLRSNIDLSKAIENKMTKNALKYPVEKAKGSYKKYTEL